MAGGGGHRAEKQVTRRWAKRGRCPVAAKDQRTISASLFGAVCPGKGKAAALVMPCVNTRAMNAHLAEISRSVEPGAHVVLLLDQAGRHRPSRLEVPAAITLLPLSPHCPERNPLENLWQFLRDNRLSNRIFSS